MAEYIEREALLEHIEQLTIIITGLRAGRNELAEFAIHYKNSILRGINDFPAADVAPVRHGRWGKVYKSKVTVTDGYVSSCCDMWNERMTRYCPNCGAKMDGGVDDG